MILFNASSEVEIGDPILAEDLLIKWGYDTTQNRILVEDLHSMALELKEWGIPIKWNF